MNTDFPKATGEFLKAEMFQDQEIPLTFKGWEKKANVDREGKNGKPGSTWKQNLKYQLRYSYPEWAKDEAGENILDKNGKPFKNRNYDPNYPQGYSVVYHFSEGKLETGSLPLFNAFCMVQPRPGDRLLIGKTGIDKETKWKVRKIGGTQASTSDEMGIIQLNDQASESEETPF